MLRRIGQGKRWFAEEDGDTEDSSGGSGEGSRLDEEDEEEEYEFEFDPEFDHIPSGHTFRVSALTVL